MAIAIMNFVHPRIYNKFHSLHGNYWLMFTLSIFGLCCVLILTYLDGFAPRHVASEEEKKEGDSAEGEKKQQGGFLAVIKGYPTILWFLIGSMVTVLQSFILQDVVASKMFQELYGLTNEDAGLVIALPNLTLGILTFICGLVIYRIGRKPLICIIIFPLIMERIVLSASILSLISIFILNILPVVDKEHGEKSFACAAPYIFVGVAHSFYSSAFWSCVP